MRSRRPGRAAVTACALLLLAGCGTGADDEGSAAATSGTDGPAAGPSRGELTAEGEYSPGMAASVDLPQGDPAAVVVLVPGGGWSSADPTGLAPLATTLSDAGLAVVTITYGTSGTGDHYPTPADDVACGVSYAAAQVPDVPVVVLGHSAGAHLAALVGLVPDRGSGDACPSPSHAADAVVGLAGPYDVAATGGLARSLFGVDQVEDPDLWEEGNPVLQAGGRPEVPFLLVHGDADDVVPVEFTSSFGDALEAAGHDVTIRILPAVDHSSVYAATVVGDAVVRWVERVVVGAA